MGVRVAKPANVPLVEVDMEKSVLDNIPVKEEGYILKAHMQPATESLCIVGKCPTCRSPFYGKTRIKVGEVPIIVKSCSCVHSPRTLEHTMVTK